MDEVSFLLNDKGNGHFYLRDEEEEVAEMVIGISGNKLTVYHTEVQPKAEGRGLAKQLLAAMVDYARAHSLTVVPLCPFVLAQFQRHPELYKDIYAPVNN